LLFFNEICCNTINQNKRSNEISIIKHSVHRVLKDTTYKVGQYSERGGPSNPFLVFAIGRKFPIGKIEIREKYNIIEIIYYFIDVTVFNIIEE
tara:strand:- start:137 stop:415 length:279 start_codon:yes stop_codon:yes gene_type:complete